MKKHPFQKGIEQSNEHLKETKLGVYRQSKETPQHRGNHKKRKK